jgi:PPOX class probable F420-dependent enzyme
VELSDALAFAAERKWAVLTTLKRDGRPQLSNIAYALHGDTFDISITAGRAKYKNMQRDPRVSLYIGRDDFRAYVVFEGDVELLPVTTEPHDATADALVAYYQTVAGDHPDWEEYRQAMVSDERLIARLTPTRAYGFTG